MATTTSSFSWPIPQSTDLVKDGATAIASLGSAIDTSMAELKGGTTGQVLSKTSNSDMDFTWVAQDDSNAIQNAIVDAKGDLISATAADTPARLAVGTNGQVLSADSSAATGLAWITPSSGFGNYSDYTPTYSSLTIGNATVVAKYATSNNTVHCYGRITFGSTTSVSGAVEISLPTTVAYTSLGYQGFCSFNDASAGQIFVGWMNFGIGGGAVFRPRYLASGTQYASDIGATSPFTWTTSDIIYWNVIYAKA